MDRGNDSRNQPRIRRSVSTEAPRGIPAQIQRLLDERVLHAHALDAAAIAGLWSKAVYSDLDAREASLSTDNRVALAYQAGLQAVHAFLLAHGYRVRSTGSHHYYSLYAAQALAESANNDSLRRDALGLDRQRARRIAAVYEAEPAPDTDLADLLGILETFLPSIRSALMALLPEAADSLPAPGRRPR
jgi:hypothetical protein